VVVEGCGALQLVVSEKAERVELPVTPMRRFFGFLLVLIVVISCSESLEACTVCFGGDPNSAMAQGTKAEILVLPGVVRTIPVSIAGTAFFWMQSACPVITKNRGVATVSILECLGFARQETYDKALAVHGD